MSRGGSSSYRSISAAGRPDLSSKPARRRCCVVLDALYPERRRAPSCKHAGRWRRSLQCIVAVLNYRTKTGGNRPGNDGACVAVST